MTNNPKLPLNVLSWPAEWLLAMNAIYEEALLKSKDTWWVQGEGTQLFNKRNYYTESIKACRDLHAKGKPALEAQATVVLV
jgi:hypothetical protein